MQEHARFFAETFKKGDPSRNTSWREFLFSDMFNTHKLASDLFLGKAKTSLDVENPWFS